MNRSSFNNILHRVRVALESLHEDTELEKVPKNEQLNSSANGRVQAFPAVAQLNEASESRMSSSAPERSLCDYKPGLPSEVTVANQMTTAITMTAQMSSAVAVAQIRGASDAPMSSSAPVRRLCDYKPRVSTVLTIPAHMGKTAPPIAKLIQVERIIGSDFFRLHSAAHAVNCRIPVLENYFSEAKRGEVLVSVPALLKDREKYIDDRIGNREEYRKEAGQLIYLYCHLLLLFHDYGMKNIQDLAPYLDVKKALVTNWVYLIKPKPLAEASLDLCKQELGKNMGSTGDNSGIQFDYDNEKNMLENFAVQMKEHKRNQKDKSTYKKQLKLPLHLRDSSFTYKNLVNMLLDFLALNSGKTSRIVMRSAPELVVKFLNRTFGERLHIEKY